MRWLAIVFAFVLLGGVVAPLPTGTATATATQESQCSNLVVYDQFRFDNATVATAANGSATVRTRNTRVRVEQATGFVRIHASNPNGYCMEFRIRLAEEIVSPAELGRVDSLDENHTASWHVVRDFERNETYTEVVVTLPADESATFAPSSLKVKSLSWTGKAASAGGSLLDGLGNFSLGWGEQPDLQKRTYRFSARNNSTIVTISLRNESTGRTVEEWQAMYRVGESGWRPIGTDADEPVFYRRVGDHQLQFIFNNPRAEVRFTANPTTIDKAQHQFNSYLSGIDVLGDLVDLPEFLD